MQVQKQMALKVLKHLARRQFKRARQALPNLLFQIFAQEASIRCLHFPPCLLL